MNEPLYAQHVVFRKRLLTSEAFHSYETQAIWILWLSILAVGMSIGWASHKYETKSKLPQHDV